MLGLSQRALAEALNVSGSAIAMIESGRSKLSSRMLRKLSEKFSVNPAWLIEGREPIQFAAPAGFKAADGQMTIAPPVPGKPLPRDFSVDHRDFSLVRLYDINLGAGPGIVPVEGDGPDLFAFPTVWLRSLGVGADLAGLVRVKGDSMAPSIPDGAIVLLDLTRRSVESKGVYAFSREGEAFVKRLVPVDLSPAGQPRSLVIISDNPLNEPETVTGSELASLNIAGRVRAVIYSL